MSEPDLVEFTDGQNTLYGTWTLPSSAADFPLVVLATGDGRNGSKGQTWQNLVPMLVEKGIATFLFDFTGLGYSPGTYEDLTLTRGCENFRGVMSFIRQNGKHDRSRIGLIGSSYGGNVALLEAANFPEIKAIGLKSASTFLPEGYERQYGSDLMKKWGEDGYSEEVELNYGAVIDALFHNTYEAASRIGGAVRLVHGTADTAVPIRHVRDLVRVMPNATLLEIEGADHWYAEGDEWQRMAVDLTDFMAKTL